MFCIKKEAITSFFYIRKGRIEITGIPGIRDIPLQKHPYLSILAEPAAQHREIGGIKRYDDISGRELAVRNAMGPVMGERYSMPPHHILCRRVDIVALLFR